MSNQGASNTGPMGNISMSSQPSMSEIMQAYPQEAVKPMLDNAMTYRAIYPEIYYKLKPYITMTCDLMISSGAAMPTQQQLEAMSDGIYDDFCKMYPDMADYMSSKKDDPPGDPPGDPPRGGFGGGFRDGSRGGFRDGYGGGFRDGFGPGYGYGGYFRRRGLGRDFIDALLLSELLGRDGYYYY